jgi:chemotaxis protein MotB
VARKRKGHHEEHPDERWLLTYADMITLLMALFIVLWAMSFTDADKFNALARSLKEAFKPTIMPGGSSILATGGDASSPTPAESESATQQKDSIVPTPNTPGSAAAQEAVARLKQAQALAQAKEEQDLEKVKGLVETELAKSKLTLDQSKVFVDPQRGLVIRIVTDKVLFAAGAYVLEPTARPLLRHIARAIDPLPNPVRVEGYTDAVPFGGPLGNDGLSGMRAASVLQFMESQGFRGRFHKAEFVGHGAEDPLVPHGPGGYAPRNRRVEIVLVRRQPAREAGSGLSEKPLGLPIGDNPVGVRVAP